MRLLNHSLGIIIAIIIIFVWQQLKIDELTVPLIGLLVLIYLVLNRLAKKRVNTKKTSFDDWSVSILTAIVLLLILQTGGLLSPIFFLLYFIPFAITFVLLPETAFIYLLGIVLLLLPLSDSSQLTDTVIKLGSVALITPLAYFFGKEYRLVNEHQQQDESAANRISNEAANVLKDQATTLPEQAKAQLADIIKQSEELKE